MKLVSILIVLLILACFGCAKRNSQSSWKRYDTLAELWPQIKSEKILSISTCDNGPGSDIDKWYSLGEIPKEQIQDCIKFVLAEAGSDTNGTANLPLQPTCSPMIKIITDKGKYISPLGFGPSQQKWEEHVSIVWLWPQLQQEGIESISFCEDRPGTNIDTWFSREIPSKNLSEFLALLERNLEQAKSNKPRDADLGLGRMKITTKKRKYLIPTVISIQKQGESVVSGIDWTSSELGELLKTKCGFTPNY
jgi:hypothetical protein